MTRANALPSADVLVVLSACRLFTEPTSSSRASGLDGQWVEQQTFPGNSLAFTLQSSDTTLTGSGESHGEAGPRGTVTVTGSTSGRDVTLHFTFKANLPAPFRKAETSPSRRKCFYASFRGSSARRFCGPGRTARATSRTPASRAWRWRCGRPVTDRSAIGDRDRTRRTSRPRRGFSRRGSAATRQDSRTRDRCSRRASRSRSARMGGTPHNMSPEEAAAEQEITAGRICTRWGTCCMRC